jgi:isocitrate dehydrogenase kinase/phosphatase
VAANIFPGDMLWKNFGVTRHGKVVFYDYDEIEYLTDCHFRRVPAPRTTRKKCPARSGTPSARATCSPRPSAPSCWAMPRVREVFMRHHADLLDADFWTGHQQRIRAGHVHDVFPYDPARRFGREP